MEGETVKTETVVVGETEPTFEGTPTKEGNAQFTYTFKEWTKTVDETTGNVTYTAAFTETVNTYTVKWIVDGAETEETYEYGVTPEFKGETPTKAADAQYSYTFTGWNPAVVPVTGEATYTAVFVPNVNSYEVTWVDEDGTTVLYTETVAYGETPEYKGETPVKTADDQYTYTFAGWTPEPSAVVGKITYTAAYTATVNKYTVKFVNFDGTELQSSEVAYGETPAYNGETPVKEADDQFTYTFAGWTPDIAAVTGEATYTALFTEEAIPVQTYTVTWIVEGETVKTETATVGETEPTFEGTPEKAADAEYTYTFEKWEKTTDAEGNVTYTAVFTKTAIEAPKFDLFGANVGLGNDLNMKFAVTKNSVADWTGHYIVITKDNADGTTTTKTYTQADWQNGGNYYIVNFTGIAAKEMTDTITVVVYNAEGKAVSNAWVDSMQAYVLRMFGNANTDVERTALIDMLNYGAAAQLQFNYGTDKLANATLTEDQKAYASDPKDFEIKLDQGDKWVGSNLTLKSNLVFSMAFNGAAGDNMYAVISYTDHKGGVHNDRVAMSKSGNLGVVAVNTLVIADGRQPITVTVYNADGSVYTTCQDSIEDYMARRVRDGKQTAIESAVMTFSDSAYAYLHR